MVPTSRTTVTCVLQQGTTSQSVQHLTKQHHKLSVKASVSEPMGDISHSNHNHLCVYSLLQLTSFSEIELKQTKCRDKLSEHGKDTPYRVYKPIH
jgi:hypothetical protein